MGNQNYFYVQKAFLKYIKNNNNNKRLLFVQGLGMSSLLTRRIVTARDVTAPGPGKV